MIVDVRNIIKVPDKEPLPRYQILGEVYAIRGCPDEALKSLDFVRSAS